MKKALDKMFKRVLFISDTHCGHEYGLTPPEWWYGVESGDESVQKVSRFQRELWNFFCDAVATILPVDILVVNGDAIDGKGDKSGGTEQYTSKWKEQCRMAARVIDEVKAPKVRLLYGTRYHTGREDDFEGFIPDMINCGDVEVEGHGFYTINGVKFDVKHKINSSSIPHGRMTALARAQLWNRIWHSEHERQPLSDVLVRSHVHYHNYCGGPGWLAMTCPALSYNTSFGIRECEGVVDVGMIVFDVYEDGRYDWWPVYANFDALKVQSILL